MLTSRTTYAYPASLNQEGLLLSEEASGTRARFRAPHFPVACRILGRVDRRALELALGDIAQRHDSLRTSFKRTDWYSPRDRAMQLTLYRRTALWVPGLFQQHVDDATAIPLTERYLDCYDELAIGRAVDDEIDEAFLCDNPHRPRAVLVHAEPDVCVLVLVVSHVLTDGWSAQILQRELMTLYTARLRDEDGPLALPSAQSYGEFAMAQYAQIVSGELADAERYWLREWTELEDSVVRRRDLPFARRRPAPPAMRRRVHTLAGDGSSALVELARRLRTTPYALARTAFIIVLHTYTGKRRIALWANFANRDTVAEGLVGHCSNTHLVAVLVDPAGSCAALARRVTAALLDAQAHQALPVAALWRHTGRNLAAQCDSRINFDYVRELTAGGDAFQPAAVAGGRRWMDLDVRLRQGAAGFALQATNNSNRYVDEGVADLLASVQSVLSYWHGCDTATVGSCAALIR